MGLRKIRRAAPIASRLREALVAQRIEHAPPKRGMQVRFLPGALEMSASRTPRGSERVLAAVALLAAAVVVTLAARTRPSFDAYGWLDWGRTTLHGGLDTNAAPSWKPLPWLFTVAFGLLGRGPLLWLWMVTVTFVSFAGLAWAGRLAGALTHAGKIAGAE